MGDRAPVELHHVIDGPEDGPPLVLSGSLGSTVEMWQPQVKALAEEHQVIRVDHRGHGGSPVPPGPYTIADLAGDVLALLDRLGLSRVDYAGLSMGGMIGMYLASEAPERIGRLALCATSAGFPDPTPWAERIEAVATGGTESIAESTVARWFTPRWAEAHPETVAWARRMVADTSDIGYLGCAQAIHDWRHAGRLGAITATTLVVGGVRDPSTPVDPHTNTVVAGIPDARLVLLDTAHLLTVERAEEATALLVEHFTVTSG